MDTGNPAEVMELSADERRLIKLYRRADGHDRAVVQHILEYYDYRFTPQVIVGGAGKGRGRE